MLQDDFILPFCCCRSSLPPRSAYGLGMWAICNLIMHVAVECLASARQNLRPCYSGNSHLGLNAFLIHLLTMTCELFFVRTAVHRDEGIWARADWPDVKPIRPFRNLWLAATRSDTDLAGAGISGLR